MALFIFNLIPAFPPATPTPAAPEPTTPPAPEPSPAPPAERTPDTGGATGERSPATWLVGACCAVLATFLGYTTATR
jgi:hypothetical protein